MSYEPTIWKKGDKVTSTKLNKIENGIQGNDEEITSIKEDLSAITTATASDVGKALKAKTVTDGKVTEWEFGDAGVAVDPTLSIEGMAADAKAVGDVVYTHGTEILELTNVNGYYSNGVVTETTTVRGKSANVTGLKTITISGTFVIWYDFYDFLDASNNVIGYLRNTTGSVTSTITVDVPVGAVKVVVSSNSITNANAFAVKKTVSVSRISVNESNITNLDVRVTALEGVAGVYLTKNGENVQIRSAFNSDNDIAIRATLNGSPQKSFCYTGMYSIPVGIDISDVSVGTVFKTMSDDICPLFFNYSYRGAGHGDDRAKKITCASPHGLTETNIGEEWIDGNSRTWLIVKIMSDTEIGIVQPATDQFNKKALENGNAVSPLTLNDKTIAFTNQAQWLMSPASNHVSVRVYADDVEITANGTYKANHIDIVERYDIIYIPAMVEALISNVGSNTNESYYSDDLTEKYCTVNNVYHFTERGAITGYQTVDFVRDVFLKQVGLIQSEPIGNLIAVPHTKEYKTLHDMGNTPSSAISLTSDKWSDADNPPNRMFQFSSAGGRGIVLGYCTDYADARPSVRKAKLSGVNGAGFYYTYHKIYPMLVSSEGEQTGGAVSFGSFTYTVPLCAYDADINAIGWFYINDDIYLIVDAQQSVNKYVQLPEYMMGRKAEIIDKDGSFTLPSPIVSSSGLLIAVDTYGSAVIKLTK